ncbi:S-formylglutathione hydrolase [Endozoicomonas atrinae]|uniref:S-formylglutathione hydrolase n=1 Tax=Endozoicomonas atrinae TaxID=1333660 RepID=UPI0008258FF3|nr:S-formylglutathione hydrolase [Endozoicomonas atrinae]
MEPIAHFKVFNGDLYRYKHPSKETKTDMVFAIFLPPQAATEPVPVLYWLSGLTCTDENFCQKAGAFRKAAELGLCIVCPDTSPRGLNLPGEHDAYDFGSGAGFYVDATNAPWSENYRMYSYVVDELPKLVEGHFKVTTQKAFAGHSMGGHGALVIGLRNPDRYCSISAFSAIAHPSMSQWGQKAFTHYLGENRELWQQYDATLLVGSAKTHLPILIDQGDNDDFFKQGQLKPEDFKTACQNSGYPIILNMRVGYDHSYYFISSFIDDHLTFHSNAMQVQ